VDYYNFVRLLSAIGYVTPQDMLAGRQGEIHAARDLNCPAAFRSAAKVASDITSVRGLLLKGTAP
jgi:hypothetical protein